jgi:hypothetical protein
MTCVSRLILTSLAVALSLGIASACYDLTPVAAVADEDGGAPCTPDMSMPDACAAEIPDGGDVDADMDAGPGEEPIP